MTEWWPAAIAALEEMALTRESFTADDIHAVCGDPPDFNQMGRLLQEGEMRGWIERTEAFTPSEREVVKKRGVRIWKSLIQGKSGEERGLLFCERTGRSRRSTVSTVGRRLRRRRPQHSDARVVRIPTSEG